MKTILPVLQIGPEPAPRSTCRGRPPNHSVPSGATRMCKSVGKRIMSIMFSFSDSGLNPPSGSSDPEMDTTESHFWRSTWTAMCQAGQERWSS